MRSEPGGLDAGNGPIELDMQARAPRERIRNTSWIGAEFAPLAAVESKVSALTSELNSDTPDRVDRRTMTDEERQRIQATPERRRFSLSCARGQFESVRFTDSGTVQTRWSRPNGRFYDQAARKGH